MTNFLSHAGLDIIGQWQASPSTLALRAPGFLPSGLTDALFGNHWGFWLAGILLAGVLFWLGRDNPRVRQVSASLGILTLAWAALALLVETPAERLRAAHAEILAAAQARDTGRILRQLDPTFRCESLRIVAASEFAPAVQALLTLYPVETAYITDYRSAMYPLQRTAELTGATTAVTIVTRIGGLGPTKTTWELHWSDDPGGWKLRQATLLRLGDQEVSGAVVR